MRILFTTLQMSGHFHPLVPVARAAVAAGHEVAFACASSFIPTVERAGFRAFPAGFDDRGRPMHELFPGFFKGIAAVWYWVWPNILVGVCAVAMTPDLLTIAREWHPDLIVRDTTEYGGSVAAEVLDIPHASVRTASVSSQYGQRHIVAEPLARFRLEDGPVGPTVHPLRPVNFESGDETLPPWVAELPDRPTIYATLGTVFSRGSEGLAIFQAMLVALRDEPIGATYRLARENLDLNPTLRGAITAVNSGIGGCDRTEMVDYCAEWKGSVGLLGAVGDPILRRLVFHLPADTPIWKGALRLEDAVSVFASLRAAHPGLPIVAKIDCGGAAYEIIPALHRSGDLGSLHALIVEWHRDGPDRLTTPLLDAGFTVVSIGSPSALWGKIYAVRGQGLASEAAHGTAPGSSAGADT